MLELCDLQSTLASGFYDYVTVRQTCPDPNGATLSIVMAPTVMMTMIDVVSNNHVIAIMYHNLRRNRTSTDQHGSESRTQYHHSHVSLLCFPRARSNAEALKNVSSPKKILQCDRRPIDCVPNCPWNA